MSDDAKVKVLVPTLGRQVTLIRPPGQPHVIAFVVDVRPGGVVDLLVLSPGASTVQHVRNVAYGKRTGCWHWPVRAQETFFEVAPDVGP